MKHFLQKHWFVLTISVICTNVVLSSFLLLFFIQKPSVASDIPTDLFPGTDNTVAVTLTNGNTTYLGGAFTKVGKNTALITKLATSDGIADTDFPAAVGSNVLAVISDGGTGWFVGGNYTSLGGDAVSYLAHVLADGSIDTDFDADVNGYVSDLDLSSDESVLYIGGSFTSVNGGTTRNRVAALDPVTGIATSFDPNVTGGVVTNVVLSPDDTLLYVGGAFTTVNGATTRNRVAAFTTADGVVTSFDPNVSSNVETITLNAAGTLLYVGGSFTTVNGATTRNRIAAFDTSTSTANAFDPDVSSQVSAIVLSPDENTVYVGGFFTTVNGATTRNRLAAFLATTGTVTSFDPNMSGSVHSLVLSSSGGTLYAGGTFSTVNGATTRGLLAAFNTATSTATSFDPNMSGTVVYHLFLTDDKSTLFAGGDYRLSNAVTRNRLAAVNNETGEILSFDPNLDSTVNSLALSSNGSVLYVGGLFSTVNGGTTRNRMAAFTTADGVVTSFDPNGTGQVLSLQLSSDNATLYAGGTFSTVNGATTRNNLAAFDTSTAIATSFDPNISSTVYGLVLDGSTLYAGGAFTTVNGATTRNRIAAFDTSTAIATSFDPNMSGIVRGLALSSDDVLYVVGQFTMVNGGTTRNRMAAFTTADGVVTSFDPNLSSNAYSVSLTPGETQVYTVGDFTTVNGATTRNRMAAFTTADGVVTSFDPNSNGQTLSVGVSEDGTKVFAAGFFTAMGNYPRAFISSFDIDSDLLPSSGGGFSGLTYDERYIPVTPRPLEVLQIAYGPKKEGDTGVGLEYVFETKFFADKNPDNDPHGFRLYNSQGVLLADTGPQLAPRQETFSVIERNMTPDMFYEQRFVSAYNGAGESSLSIPFREFYLPRLTPFVRFFLLLVP